MSSLLEDDTRYVKLWLLLVKGGTYVFKKHTQMILDKDKTTIDICLKPHEYQLSKKKGTYPKLWELLCSNSGQPKDIDVLDISALAYVLLNIFDKKMKAVEKVAITNLREQRNTLIHRGDTQLSEQYFLGEWSQLIMVLYQLSNGLSSNDQNYVKKTIDDISKIPHLDKAIDDLKPFENQDDFVKTILAEKLCIYERRLDELTKRICELEKNIRNTESRLLELTARITVISSTPTDSDAAYRQLLEAIKRYLVGGHVNQEGDEVSTVVNNILTDMGNDGASIKKVEEGSVLITFSCSTLTSLKSAFLYLTKTVYIQRLQELEGALSQSVGCCVKLNVNIILESLISTLDKEENCTSDKSVVLTVSCMGSKGVRSVCNNLVNESSTNTVNNLAKFLSTSVGQRIELHRSIDLDKLENEISLLERLHGYHDVQRSLSDGQCEIKQTQSELKDGQSEIKQTQSETKDGQSKLRLSLKNVHRKQKDQTNLLKSLQTKIRLDDSEQPCNTTKSIKFITNVDKIFVFRYQYLLIEVGTGMLRRVFEHVVGKDFKVYLDKNPHQKAKFQQLLSRNILTSVQLQLLPPIDNTPSSDKFDITLLTCLIKNVCSLCPSSDKVWSNPQPTDNRLEAYIAKLKQCRNDLVHYGSVLEDETVLASKWNELHMILQGLASYCGFPNLQEEIDKARSIEIDDRLKEKFEKAIKDWRRDIYKMISPLGSPSSIVGHLEESKKQHGDEIASLSTTVGHLEESKKQHGDEIASLSTTVGHLEKSKKQHGDGIATLSTTVGTLEESKKQHGDEIATLSIKVGNIEECTKQHGDAIRDLRSDMGILDSKKGRLCEGEMADIQKILIDGYQNDICSSLPLCPLLEDEKGGLLKLYEVPTMYVVNYHNVEKQQTDKSSDSLEEVKTCSDLFHVKDKDCKNIYLTGDAGVGKTSFCKFLSLLWCKSKLGKKWEKVDMQEYIDYLVRFEFVFYVNLRDTHFTDLKAIVVNQLFYSENKECSNRMYNIVENILGNHDSLVIMDGLDEWTPKPTDKRRYEIPVRPKSLKCVYLTTCRPYKIENVRLSETNLDHQIKMAGLGETEIESYVCSLINIINTKHNENKNNEEFMMAVKEVNLLDVLHIPMTTSHLVMLWFDRPLTSMSKSLIYGNIMDMLFKLAHKKGIVIQQSNPSKLKLPEMLSELKHFKDHFSQIEQLCLLSFKLLFEHDTDITSLVFTRDQLASELYCLSEEETNLFCTIGILSKNKVKRKFGKQEHKLSFLHKSYLEFFAAIYVSTLDTSDVLEVFSQCRTINDVLKYKDFLIFYAGLSIDSFVSLITRIYSLISKDLDLTRVLSIFSTFDDIWDKRDQLEHLQDLILKCNIEGSYQIGNSLPLEDFIFIHLTDTETKYLRKLILSNMNKVRLLRSYTGEYFDEFDKIINLKGLCFHSELQSDKNCREFIELIKKHKSSLQIISVHGQLNTRPVLSLPLEDLHYLTSLSLEDIVMSHEDRQYLTKFLSNNSQLKHVRLVGVKCTEHSWFHAGKRWYYWWCNDACGSFELARCNELVYLHIENTNIVCTNINTSSLEYIKLSPCSESIARSYIDIFNSIQYALELKHLDISGRLDDHMVETLITNVQYLFKIESIRLLSITIRDNVSFLLHPSVKQVLIKLFVVTMTARWFHTFIESVMHKHCCIKFVLYNCIISQDDGDTKVDMSEKESVDYIHDYIRSISAKRIVKYISSTSYSNIEFVITDNQ